MKNDNFVNDVPSVSQKLLPVSVVIATLGGDVLGETIRHLNQGVGIPSEILICIPEDIAMGAEQLSGGNVKIIKTPCYGQVAQRSHGLGKAGQPLVLQLDDDVVLERSALDHLVQAISNLGVGNAVAPLYRHLSNGRYATEYSKGLNGWLQSLSASAICGAPWGVRRMGTISPAGIGYGVDRSYCGGKPFETEWLPGGCVLCHKKDLVTHDYYPFTGKALTEDLVHSIMWRKQGVRLWVIPQADCATTVALMPDSRDFIKASLRAHGYVVRLVGGSMWRLYLWFAVFSLKRAVLATGEMFSSALVGK